MSTLTLEPVVTTVVAAPLTESEQNSLIALAASAQPTKTVQGGRSTRESRGWSLGGRVD